MLKTLRHQRNKYLEVGGVKSSRRKGTITVGGDMVVLLMMKMMKDGIIKEVYQYSLIIPHLFGLNSKRKGCFSHHHDNITSPKE